MTDSAPHETSTIATLQSLIVAFVLAMTFRGFVTEGFVIPTGSMAPTLLGEHLLLHSQETGDTYPVDFKRSPADPGARGSVSAAYDPMLGENYPLSTVGMAALRPRMGDRILVFKCLYPFTEPDRFDVVVFKNPTDPDSEAGNYIKRLIGLPGEAIWLTDGDVFVAPAGDSARQEAYEIQRKPEFVQRAVWQPVQDSDYIAVDPENVSPRYASPWVGEAWDTSGRTYRCETAEPSLLTWDIGQMRITDWTPYNMFSLPRSPRADVNLSDIRVAADVVADAAGLSMELEMETRGFIYRFRIGDGTAETAMRPIDQADEWTTRVSVEAPMPQPGRVYRVEFWHVDQSMTIFINGRRAGASLDYDWTPKERIERAFDVPYETWVSRFPMIQPTEPILRFSFRGSPLSLHRVRLDRDLYYRADSVTAQTLRNPTSPGFQDLVAPNTPAFGTHPAKPAVLGPDHYFMLGDNSPASSDSRLWGNPHPLVAQQVDGSPFVVHRKLLLGKAWVVYFPAPYSLSENGRGVIPDFGRLRFIR